jgi:hypothetical protein
MRTKLLSREFAASWFAFCATIRDSSSRNDLALDRRSHSRAVRVSRSISRESSNRSRLRPRLCQAQIDSSERKSSTELHRRSSLARARVLHAGLVSSIHKTHPGGCCSADRSPSRQPETCFGRHAQALSPAPGRTTAHRAPRGSRDCRALASREQRGCDRGRSISRPTSATRDTTSRG